MRLQQRQARETGICSVRRELYSQFALVSFYVIVLHCKCYFIVCQICHSQVFLLSE